MPPLLEMALVAGTTTAIASGASMYATSAASNTQSQTALKTTQMNIDYNKSVIQQGVQSFRNAGLPEFEYWSGGKISEPNTLYHLGGSNFYEGSGVNANLPLFSNSAQQWTHFGRPNPPNEQPTTSRAGLGSARNEPTVSYNARNQTATINTAGQSFQPAYNRAPPPTIAYNSRGTQATISPMGATNPQPFVFSGTLPSMNVANSARRAPR